jgi:hypothetical protein
MSWIDLNQAIFGLSSVVNLPPPFEPRQSRSVISASSVAAPQPTFLFCLLAAQLAFGLSFGGEAAEMISLPSGLQRRACGSGSGGLGESNGTQ